MYVHDVKTIGTSRSQDLSPCTHQVCSSKRWRWMLRRHWTPEPPRLFGKESRNESGAILRGNREEENHQEIKSSAYVKKS